ncbi:MAG: DUF4258 domain-containing protein [Euryarchaeota archaeon]|nr:DUF4258 domain-containing protein [Euryarchaeota archaeon]
MEVHFTRHARLRMVERGISTSEVLECLRTGTKRVQGDKLVAAFTYFEVVYRKAGPNIVVITVVPRW